MAPTAVHAILDRHRDLIESLDKGSDAGEPYLFHCGVADSTQRVAGVFETENGAAHGGLRIRHFTLRSLLRAGLTIADNVRRLAAEQSRKEANDSGPLPPVAVLLAEGPLLPACQLGVLFSGHPVLPLDPADPRLGKMAHLANPCLFIVPDGFADRDRIKQIGGAVVEVSKLLIRRNEARLFPLRTLPAERQHSHLYFTSGTSGVPKACVLNHAALLAYAAGKPALHNISSDSVVLILSPPTFDPQWGDLVSALYIGSRIVTVDRNILLDGRKLALAIEKTGATHVCTTPAVWRHVPVPKRGETTLQVVALGGERTPRALAEAWFQAGVRFLNTYGVTECCVYQAVAEFEPGAECGERLLGTPVDPAGVFLRLLNDGEKDENELNRDISDHTLISIGREASIGLKPGYLAEIVVAGTMVGRYLAEPSAATTGFFRHPSVGPCFYTGDLVKWVPDSKSWALVGRHVSDTRIKLSGRRADLLEIEAALADAFRQLTKEICVVPVPAGDSLALACACVASESVEEGDAVSVWESVLLRLSNVALPAYLAPTIFYFLDALPVSRTGKLDRKTVRRIVMDRLDSKAASDAEADHHDHTGWAPIVADAWKKVLNLNRHPTPNSTFPEHGGDSFACARVCTLIWEAYRSARASDGADETADEDEDGNGGKWGERLPGAFAPGELIKRPRFSDWTSHFRDRVGRLTSNEEDESNDAPIDADTDDLQAIFRRACVVPCPAVVSFLLAGRLHPDLDTPPGSATPLHSALLHGRFEVARLLLKEGADPNRRGVGEMQAVHFAVQGSLHCSASETAAMFEFLVGKGSRLDARDGQGQTALHHAARVGVSRSTFELLLSMQTKPTSGKRGPVSKRGGSKEPSNPLGLTDHAGRTPLHWATINGHRTLVEYLVHYHREASLIDAKDADGETAVVMAMRRARCGAEERGGRGGATVWGDISILLGGGGSTKEVRVYAK